MTNEEKVNAIIKYYNCDVDVFLEILKVALEKNLNKEISLFKNKSVYMTVYDFYIQDIINISTMWFQSNICIDISEMSKVMPEVINNLYLVILRDKKINEILDGE